MSGLSNTAYSQFYLQQLPQVGTTRTAILRTNVTFDYDTPGKISMNRNNKVFIVMLELLNLFKNELSNQYVQTLALSTMNRSLTFCLSYIIIKIMIIDIDHLSVYINLNRFFVFCNILKNFYRIV